MRSAQYFAVVTIGRVSWNYRTIIQFWTVVFWTVLRNSYATRRQKSVPKPVPVRH